MVSHLNNSEFLPSFMIKILSKLIENRKRNINSRYRRSQWSGDMESRIFTGRSWWLVSIWILVQPSWHGGATDRLLPVELVLKGCLFLVLFLGMHQDPLKQNLLEVNLDSEKTRFSILMFYSPGVLGVPEFKFCDPASSSKRVPVFYDHLTWLI